MLIDSNFTFWTASERSSRYNKLYLNKRFTHRISFAERQRRIDFVRAKLVSKMFDVLYPDPSVHIDLPFNKDDLTNYLSTVGIKYNKGRLKVNMLAMAGNYFVAYPFLRDFNERFDDYWDLLVRIKQLNLEMKQYRRFFGSNCLSTGEITFTKFFYRELNSYHLFGKPYYLLKESKKIVARTFWEPKIYDQFKEHHPSWVLIKDHFVQLRGFISRMDRNRGVLDIAATTSSSLSKLINSIPMLNHTLICVRTLSQSQLIKLVGNKHKHRCITLWYLLYNLKAIQKTLVLDSDLRLNINIALNSLCVYIPFVEHVDRSDKGLPSLVKFKAPAVVRHHRYFEHRFIPEVDFTTMPIFLKEMDDRLRFPVKRQRLAFKHSFGKLFKL